MDVTYSNFADFLKRSGIGRISLARLRYNAYVECQESMKQDSTGIHLLKAWIEKRKEKTQESYHQMKARIEKKLRTRHQEIRLAMRIVTKEETKKGKKENEIHKSGDLQMEELSSNWMQQLPEELGHESEKSNADDESVCQLEDDINLLSRFVGHF